jgi:enoyl-CoA hydratase/carnithine racemase
VPGESPRPVQGNGSAAGDAGRRRRHSRNGPVIGAINSHILGVGLVLAAFCDIRVGSQDVFFTCPGIDRGVPAGGASFFTRLTMPVAKIRELICTGRRFNTQNIAKKSLPALKASKPGSGWPEQA